MVAENDGKEGVWRSIWADGELVGSISVERKAGDDKVVGEIGYMILTPFWAHGDRHRGGKADLRDCISGIGS